MHGSRNVDQRVTVNGVNTMTLQAGGNIGGQTPDVGSAAEVTVDTNSLSADLPTGGVRINFVPKDGGNKLLQFDVPHVHQRGPAGRQLLGRAPAGTSFCYNVGRFLAASGPFTLGILQARLAAGAVTSDAKLEAFRTACCWVSGVFLVGLIALVFLPETRGKPLPEDEKAGGN